jgi:hypothetical protein
VIRLYPTPTQSGTLKLVVAREPLCSLEYDYDEPELPSRHHRSLVWWALFRAFSKFDTEVNDLQRAAECEARFGKVFGERRSARSEKWIAEQSGAVADALC